MIPRPQKLAALLLVVVAVRSGTARADDDLFAEGKPVSFFEEDADRRFLKTRLAKALEEAPKDPACARVAGAFLIAFAEAVPYFHKKDQNFFLDPGWVSVLQGQMTTSKFPAVTYYRQMVRRALIEKKAPEAWLTTAKTLKSKHKAPIDLARLAYAVDGAQSIDSFYFTMQMLFERFTREVLLAPTVAQASALDRFTDRYVDRDVAWGNLILADIHKWEPPPPPPPKKGKGKTPPPPPPPRDDEVEKPYYVATLIVPVPPPPPSPLPEPVKPSPLRISVRLDPEQYVDVRKAVVLHRYLVRGRLWGFKPGGDQPDAPTMTIELRDGLLFEDRDWSGYVGFASREDVARCELCVNDLSTQGLKDTQGVGARDGFAH